MSLPTDTVSGTKDYDFDTVDPLIKSVITQGLTKSSHNLSDVRPHCTATNCTFSQYSTLGVCASTEDFTSHIVPRCGYANYDDSGHAVDCTYTIDALQDHPGFRPTRFTDMDVLLGASALNARTVKPTGLHRWYDAYELPDNDALSEIYILYVPSEKGAKDLNLNTTLRALKGTFRLCIYDLETSVSNGQTHTMAVKVHDDLDWQVDQWPPGLQSSLKWGVHTTLPNDPEKQIFRMDGSVRQAFTNYMAGGVFFGKWYRGPKDYGGDSTDNFAARAIGLAMYENSISGAKFVGTRGVDDLLENVALGITNA